jgi:ankyrin repeat protein
MIRIEEMDEDGRIILFYTMENEYLEIIKLLLEIGINIMIKNRYG